MLFHARCFTHAIFHAEAGADSSWLEMPSSSVGIMTMARERLLAPGHGGVGGAAG